MTPNYSESAESWGHLQVQCPDPTPELSEPTQRPVTCGPIVPRALGRVTGWGSSLTTPPPHRPVPWPPSPGDSQPKPSTVIVPL